MEEYMEGIQLEGSLQPSSIDIKYDKRLSNFIIAYFFVQALNLFVKLVIGDFGAWNLISRGLLALLLLFSLQPIIKRNFSGALVAEAFLVLSFLFTLLSGGADYQTYKTIMINALIIFMPMGIAITCIRDKSILLKRFYIVAWPTQAILILILLNLSGFQYSMPGGYALVFQMLIVMDHLFWHRKWYDLIAVIVDFLVILLFGSRGPIVCIVAMILIRLFFSHKIGNAKRIAIAFCIVAVAVILFFNYQNILNGLLQLARSLDYSSRNLRILAMKQLTDDSGRTAIHEMYYRLILQRPVLGYGLVGGWISTAFYPHQIYIELILSNGIVIGTIACIVVTALAVKGVTNNNEEEQRLAQIMLAYCFSLFLSDSFIMCPMFFLLMGIGVSQTKLRFKLGNFK